MKVGIRSRPHDELRNGRRVCDICGAGLGDREMILEVDVDEPESEAWEICPECQGKMIEMVKEGPFHGKADGTPDEEVIRIIRELVVLQS